jgi:NitT/TauT family transport system permease protein
MSLFRARNPLSKRANVAINIISISLLLLSYIVIAEVHHSAQPKDQLIPTVGMIFHAAQVAVTPDEFTGEASLGMDVFSSVRLLALGYGTAVLISLVLGLHAGAWPWLNAIVDPVLKFFSYTPTMALLCFFLMTLGSGDESKIAIIFLATVVPLTRGLILTVQNVPDKQLWKAETLGATNPEVIWITLRRITEPKFLDDVRLQLGSAWVYLIAAELIASQNGLGYRISIASRNLNVASTLFHVLVITGLAFMADRVIWMLNRLRNRWALQS